MARSITDQEIGLIKALLARGERNVDIQFYFNRQDRPANSGRISQIRQGTYGPNVPQASEADLDEFLAQFQQAEAGVNLANNLQRSPTLAERALNQFEERDDGSWYLRNGETSHQECKEVFNRKKLIPIVKAIAGLANNKGGFIFLGVEDNDGRVVGLKNEEFAQTDISTISQKVKSLLMPTPDFTKIQIDVGGNSIGLIYVEEHNEPPVIAIKDGDEIESGSIFFRSPGQTAKISAGDLFLLLKKRDQFNQGRLLKSAQKLSEIGLSNSLIVDTAEGSLEADGARISIDRELADQLEFIREGEFDEVGGAPALKLVGDVRAVDPDGEVHERIAGKALTAESVLQAFLNEEKVRNPIEYIKESAFVQRQWLPLHYFIRLSDFSVEDAISLLRETEPVYANSKRKALSRLSREISAHQEAKGSATPILERLLARDIDTIEDDFNDRFIVQAIMALPENFEGFSDILEILERILARTNKSTPHMTNVFRAAARLDEIAFGPV